MFRDNYRRIEMDKVRRLMEIRKLRPNKDRKDLSSFEGGEEASVMSEWE